MLFPAHILSLSLSSCAAFRAPFQAFKHVRRVPSAHSRHARAACSPPTPQSWGFVSNAIGALYSIFTTCSSFSLLARLTNRTWIRKSIISQKNLKFWIFHRWSRLAGRTDRAIHCDALRAHCIRSAQANQGENGYNKSLFCADYQVCVIY